MSGRSFGSSWIIFKIKSRVSLEICDDSSISLIFCSSRIWSTLLPWYGGLPNYLTMQQLIEENSKTPDIYFRSMGAILVVHNFRWHVFICSTDTRTKGVVRQVTRPAKIAQFDIEQFVEEDILWLYISMYNFVLMQISNCEAGLVKKPKGELLGQTLAAVNVKKQRAIPCVFKKYIDDFPDLKAVHKLNNVCVVK